MKKKIFVFAIISILLISSLSIINVIRADSDDSATVEIKGLEVSKLVLDEESGKWVNEITTDISEEIVFKVTVTYHSTSPSAYKLTDLIVVDILPQGIEYQSAVFYMDTEIYFGESEIIGKQIFWYFTRDWKIELYDGDSIHIQIYAKTIDIGENINTVEASGIEMCSAELLFCSDDATVIVKKDTTPPITTCYMDGIMGKDDWFKSEVRVTLNAVDDLSGVQVILYRINGGCWFNVSDSVVTFKIDEDGYHIIEFYSIDNAGNQEEIKEVTVKIDTTPPKTRAILPRTETYFEGIPVYFRPVIVKLISEDITSGIDKTYYRFTSNPINTDDWIEYEEEFYVYENGLHTIEYYSVDNAGNIEDIKEVTFIVNIEFQPNIIRR